MHVYDQRWIYLKLLKLKLQILSSGKSPSNVSWFIGVCPCKICKMLCLGISRLPKPRFFTLYTEGAQEDPSLKAKLQEAPPSHVYGCCAFPYLRTPSLSGEENWVDQCAAAEFISALAKVGTTPTLVFLRPLAPPPGKIRKCASAREK